MSTRMCDVNIPGLPITLTGHIIPDLSIALLFGIRVYTDVGYTVVFNKDECVIYFKGSEILWGHKDPTTNLWTLPLGCTTAQHDSVMPPAPVRAFPKVQLTQCHMWRVLSAQSVPKPIA
jgi:hypothetical protein